MNVLGWPTCARCGKPVEKIEKYKDMRTDEMVFSAFCHGAIDELRLGQEQIANMTEIHMTVAFYDPKMLPGPSLA